MIYDSGYIQRVYRWSPTIGQHALVSAYGILKLWEQKSESFTGYVRELERSQWWSGAQLRELQEIRLATLIRHAYKNVPYYRRLFDKLGLKPEDIRTADDLYKLPVLTKQDVRSHFSDLQACNIPTSKSTLGRTGGTTGVPLQFSLDNERVIFDHALIERHWSWAGFRKHDLVVMLRGFPLIPPETSSGVYWRYDWATHRIYLSGFHLSLSIMPRYLEMLRKWKPKFIAGYPSNIFTLARFLELKKEYVSLEAIFTSSEVLTPVERKVIERQFQCKIWDRYGTGERLVVGQQCEHGNYHQNVEFGILQIGGPDGMPAPSGVKGELIQTGLTNFSMPLIRYATEDIGWLTNGACRCGRGLPLMGPVEGRKDDVIVTADGRIMPRAGLDQIHEFADNLERCQLVQEKLGEVLVRVLPRPGFGPEDERELANQLSRRLGKGTQVRIDIVDRLDLTISGKERFIVSKLNLDELAGLPLGMPQDQVDLPA